MAITPSTPRTSTENTAQELRSFQLALGTYVLVFGAKLAAYWMTGVMALLAEALHTLSDIFISGFLLVAVWYSDRQADEMIERAQRRTLRRRGSGYVRRGAAAGRAAAGIAVADARRQARAGTTATRVGRAASDPVGWPA